MKKFVAALAVAGIGVGTMALAPSATAASASDFDPKPISWGACTRPSLVKAGAECGFLEVPLDYAKPGGEKISIAVSRVKHKAAESQGVMLVNPGGPGGSGLGLSTLGRAVPKKAGEEYDWIGFDPRGVGRASRR